eukprot:gene20742-24860_t
MRCTNFTVVLIMIGSALIVASEIFTPALRADADSCSWKQSLYGFNFFSCAIHLGTRFHVYRFGEFLNGQLDIDEITKVKLLDGDRNVPLASLADKPREQVWSRLRPLMEELKSTIPSDDLIPFYIWATAGMRVVPKAAADKLYEEIRQLIRAEYPMFSLGAAESGKFTQGDEATKNLRTITGQDEGFNAWVAANWLNMENVRRFSKHQDLVMWLARGGDLVMWLARGEDLVMWLARGGDLVDTKNIKLASTVGIIDVGGGSTQVVGLMPGAEGKLASSPTLDADTIMEFLYIRSYLGFGAQQMENTVRKHLLGGTMTNVMTDAAKRQDDESGVYNVNYPCGFKGWKDQTTALTGTGDFVECVQLIRDQMQRRVDEMGGS